MIRAVVTRAKRVVVRTGRRTCAAGERRIWSPLMIMMYHRVDEMKVDPWRLSVDPASFERQIRVLAEEGTIVPLGAQRRVGSVQRRATIRPRFAITFDDGYACNYHAALPVLEKYDAPATFFISTGFLDRASFWWDRWSSIAFEPSIDGTALLRATRHLVDPNATSNEMSRQELHRSVHRTLMYGEPEWIVEELDAVSQSVGSGHEIVPRPLTSEELVTFANHPLVEIGAHTVHHRSLPALDSDSATAEMVGARESLDALLGPHERGMAYPFGNVTKPLAKLADNAGFPYAVTIASRTVSVLDRPTLLPRWTPPRREESVDFPAWLRSRSRI